LTNKISFGRTLLRGQTIVGTRKPKRLLTVLQTEFFFCLTTSRTKKLYMEVVAIGLKPNIALFLAPPFEIIFLPVSEPLKVV